MTMTADGLAKLMEECGEVVQVCAKKMACPNSDEHWDKKGSLKRRMEDEIADVAAASQLVISTYALDSVYIEARAKEKLALFLKWHANVDEEI